MSQATASVHKLPDSGTKTTGHAPPSGEKKPIDPQKIPSGELKQQQKPSVITKLETRKDASVHNQVPVEVQDVAKPKPASETIVRKVGSKVVRNIQNAKRHPRRRKREEPPPRRLPKLRPLPSAEDDDRDSSKNVIIIGRIRPSTKNDQQSVSLENEKVIRISQPSKHEPDKIQQWVFRTERSFYGGAQQSVFDTSLADALAEGINGVNSLVMVCGNKGCGKMFTFCGDERNFEQRGIIPRALQHLFKLAKASENEYVTKICVSYVDIVGGEVVDLLGEKRYNDVKMLSYKNLSHPAELLYARVTDPEQALLAFYMGNCNRVRLTPAIKNDDIPFHTIFTFYFEVSSKLLTQETYKVSKVTVVKMGSVTNMKAVPVVDEEVRKAQLSINRSYAALEQIIAMRNDPSYKVEQIPTRQSKLAHLTQDAFRSQSTKFVLLVCLSAEREKIPCSLASLRFAMRVKGFKVEPKPNSLVNLEAAIRHLQEQAEDLKMELRMNDLLNGREPVDYVAKPPLQDLNKLQREVKDFAEGRSPLPKFASFKHLEQFIIGLRKYVKDGDLQQDQTDQGDSSLSGREAFQTAPGDTDDTNKGSPSKGLIDAEGTGDLDDRDGIGLGSAPSTLKGKGLKNLMKKKKDDKPPKIDKPDKTSVTPKKPTLKKPGKDSAGSTSKDGSSTADDDPKQIKPELSTAFDKPSTVAGENAITIQVPALGPGDTERDSSGPMSTADAYRLFITKVPQGVELYKNLLADTENVKAIQVNVTTLANKINASIQEADRITAELEVQGAADKGRYKPAEMLGIANAQRAAVLESIERLRCSIQEQRERLEKERQTHVESKIKLSQTKQRLYQEFQQWLPRMQERVSVATGSTARGQVSDCQQPRSVEENKMEYHRRKQRSLNINTSDPDAEVFFRVHERLKQINLARDKAISSNQIVVGDNTNSLFFTQQGRGIVCRQSLEDSFRLQPETVP